MKWESGRRSCGQQRCYASDIPAASTFSKLDVPELAPVVYGYLSHGFIIRGSLVQGSVALLPRAMFNWKVLCQCMVVSLQQHESLQVDKFEDLTPESFTLFHLIEPRLGRYVHAR